MKVGVYHSLKDKSDLEAFEVFNALKRRSDVEEIVIIDPKKLRIKIVDSKVEFLIEDKVVDKDMCDVMFIRGGFASLPTAIELVKYCRNLGMKVFDNNLVAIKYLINKRSDYIKLAHAGLPVPNSYFFSNTEMLKAANLSYPLVMKATNTGKGFNIHKINSAEEAEKIITEDEAKPIKFVFQDIIDYVHDLRVLVIGNEVLGCMKRIPKAGDFRANFSLGGTVEPFEATEEIKSLAIKAAQACELQVSGVDVLIDRSGKLWILEANRTPGLEGISQALGLQIGDKAVEYMIQNAS